MALKTKASVNYSLGGDHCHACVHFQEGDEGANETGTCELVAGAIGPHCWCKLFKRMAGAKCPKDDGVSDYIAKTYRRR